MGVTASKEVKMPLRSLNRQQTLLLPPTLDELIPDDHPARFNAMFVDNLDEAEWRKLEAACLDQMPYLWLTSWQHPDHNTLWQFYKEHHLEMRYLFKLTVRTAVNMDLVDMAVQAIDCTKLQANAAKDRTYDAKGLQRLSERTAFVSGLFLAIIRFCEVAISHNAAITC
jgi:hypothetical protein